MHLFANLGTLENLDWFFALFLKYELKQNHG